MVEFEGMKAFDTNEVAEITGKNVQVIRRWIREGALKANKVSGTYYVTEREIKRAFFGIESDTVEQGAL